MNRYIKVCGIIALMIFSFYYTEKVALYVQNNTPLKKEIIAYKKNNVVSSVNAEIDGKYIIPGINGIIVNVDKSYLKMKAYNVFSESKLIYDQVKPDISVINHKDKIIKQANTRKNAVSIIINNDSKFSDYLDNNDISYDYINKTNYCIKISDVDCKNVNKYTVEPTIILNSQNFLKSVNKITKGYIIYLDESLNLNYVYVLINYIRYSNLNIIKLNSHLSENYQL